MTPLPLDDAQLESLYRQTIGQKPGILSLTAAGPGEGVSTLCYAIARRAALSGHRALLVDLNAIRPSVHARFALDHAFWRADDPAGGASEITQLAGTGLSVLPAPAGTAWHPSFRERASLGACLARWRTQFSAVILDLSPVDRSTAIGVPAELIAALSDHTLLVALAAATPAMRIAECIHRLKGAGVIPTGIVLNDFRNPGLGAELQRSSHRLDRILPGLARRFRARVASSTLLNLAQ